MPNLEPLAGTALITGAAHGIGAAFARQLAAQGKRLPPYGCFPCGRLVLVDKDETGLASMVESLARSGHDVESLPANLARPEDQDRVVERIAREEELCLLINNAGFGDPKLFFEQDAQLQCDMLQVHVVSAVRFCRAALTGMVRLSRGGIINVSTLAADLPVPYNVMYGSTKAFLRSFSETLRADCAATGVTVQLLCPGYTHTSFHDSPNYKDLDLGRVPRWMWSSADSVATASLRALARRKFLCVPGLRNQCIGFLLRSRIVPMWIIRRILT
jgi:short-subunit dehydrogenase